MAKRKSGRSVLFLSADLVGSTSYKQKGAGDWQLVFLSFYRQFPQYLAKATLELAAGSRQAPEFALWKGIGDELVFEANVAHEDDVSMAVRIWLAAMDICERDILAERELALKGSAFIATFPGPDSESAIPRKPFGEKSDKGFVTLNDEAFRSRSHAHYQYDYFGPSVDTGFRVSQLATHRYFTLTTEVAWAIALSAQGKHTHSGREEHPHIDDVVFRGTKPLKGVWDGRDYPLFAIDRQIQDPVNDTIARAFGVTPTAQSIIDVCHACSADPKWPCRLYLPDSTHPGLTSIPDDAMHALRSSEYATDGMEDQKKGAGNGDQLPADAPMG